MLQVVKMAQTAQTVEAAALVVEVAEEVEAAVVGGHKPTVVSLASVCQERSPWQSHSVAMTIT
jgi:hypothetical protein